MVTAYVREPASFEQDGELTEITFYSGTEMVTLMLTKAALYALAKDARSAMQRSGNNGEVIPFSRMEA